MKSNVLVGLISMLLMAPFSMQGQLSPYSLSPKWHFGHEAGLDFTAGSPVNLAGGKTNTAIDRIEGTSVICDPSKEIVFYTDNYDLFDANHNLVLSPLMGGTSSTQGSVIVPDPADPANRFYLFTANVDPGGQGDQGPARGVHYYHIEKNSGSINVLGTPVQLAAANETSEQICAGTDLNGNYWIVAHQGGAFPPGWGLNKIFAWPVTASGVGARVTSSVGGTTGNNYWHGSMKINKCQTRLAAVYADGGLASNGVSYDAGCIEIYSWDAATGTVTGLIRRIAAGLPDLYGCEFSPDGNILYFTSLTENRLYQLDIASGDIYTDASWTSSNNIAEMGNLQLGPDDKIYVVNVADGDPDDVYLGVVNNPNVAGAGCNYDRTGFTIKTTGSLPTVGRGIANVAWTNPNLPEIRQAVLNCTTVRFDFDFNTYFLDSIPVQPGSIEWNFGEGNGFQTIPAYPLPVVDYGAEGSYNVQLRFKDNTCGQTWTTQKTVDVNCSLPVQWLNIHAEREKEGVRISWATSQEIGNGHFVIERSADGKSFEPIGSIDGNMTLFAVSEYSFFDEKPLSGDSYYRIRQVDVKGSFSYSKTLFLPGEGVQINIYPNPSSAGFHLKAIGFQEGLLVVTDMLGREIYSSPLSAEMSFGDIFSPGTYIAKIVYNEETQIQKLVKE